MQKKPRMGELYHEFGAENEYHGMNIAGIVELSWVTVVVNVKLR
jgi:hypothetical protein